MTSSTKPSLTARDARLLPALSMGGLFLSARLSMDKLLAEITIKLTIEHRKAHIHWGH